MVQAAAWGAGQVRVIGISSDANRNIAMKERKVIDEVLGTR